MEDSPASVCHFSISNMIKTALGTEFMRLLSRKEMWTKLPEGHEYTKLKRGNYSSLRENKLNQTRLILTGGLL